MLIQHKTRVGGFFPSVASFSLASLELRAAASIWILSYAALGMERIGAVSNAAIKRALHEISEPAEAAHTVCACHGGT